MKNILIAVSGTGGHVYPGIALAYELKKFGYNPVFVVNSNKNGVSLNIVKNSGYDYKILDFKAPPRKISLQMLCFPFKFIKVLFEAKSIIKQTKPCVAIGMGAYLSFPMLLVATEESREGRAYHEPRRHHRCAPLHLARHASRLLTSFLLCCFREEVHRPSGAPQHEPFPLASHR